MKFSLNKEGHPSWPLYVCKSQYEPGLFPFILLVGKLPGDCLFTRKRVECSS